MTVKAKSAADIVVENKEEFIAVFPELEKPINMLLGSEDRPECTKCQRNKYERDITATIMLSDKSDRDVSKLLQYTDQQLMSALTYQPSPNEPMPAPDASMPTIKRVQLLDSERTGCPDCVCKHLSQALILMDEVVQGYPEHVKLALEHTDRALLYSTGKNVKTRDKLKELQVSLQGIIDEEKSEQSTEFYLARARTIMTEMLEDDMAHPLSVWRVIGHMGEAADECVQDNPQLAGLIRQERLALMEDHLYRPPLAKLLNDARKGRG